MLIRLLRVMISFIWLTGGAACVCGLSLHGQIFCGSEANVKRTKIVITVSSYELREALNRISWGNDFRDLQIGFHCYLISTVANVFIFLQGLHPVPFRVMSSSSFLVMVLFLNCSYQSS